MLTLLVNAVLMNPLLRFLKMGQVGVLFLHCEGLLIRVLQVSEAKKRMFQVAAERCDVCTLLQYDPIR